MGKTASGKSEIILAEDVSWSGFKKIANKLATDFKAKIENKAESVNERVWTINIEGVSYCLSWDDLMCEVSIFAWKNSDDLQIEKLFSRMKNGQKSGWKIRD